MCVAWTVTVTVTVTVSGESGCADDEEALPLQRYFAATRNATPRGEELTEGEQLAQAQR